MSNKLELNLERSLKHRIIGAVVGLVGFIVVGVAADWLVALGVLFMLAGNNIERGA